MLDTRLHVCMKAQLVAYDPDDDTRSFYARVPAGEPLGACWCCGDDEAALEADDTVWRMVLGRVGYVDPAPWVAWSRARKGAAEGEAASGAAAAAVGAAVAGWGSEGRSVMSKDVLWHTQLRLLKAAFEAGERMEARRAGPSHAWHACPRAHAHAHAHVERPCPRRCRPIGRR